MLTTYMVFAQNAVPFTPISAQAAVDIAVTKGYYKCKSPWLEPIVLLDSIQRQWIITSTKLAYVKRGNCYLNKENVAENCNCKNTNGCTDRTTKQIKINALTGRIIEKLKTKERFPNYE